MIPLVHASIITGVIFTLQVFFGGIHRFSTYLSVFLFSLGMAYMCRCESYQIINPPMFQLDSEYAQLNNSQTKEYKRLIDFHKSNGQRCYNDAFNRCFLIPDISDRKKASYCFESLMSTIAGTTPMSKVVCAILVAMTNYGLDCIEEWSYIQNKMHWAQYHFEMMEFYIEVLQKA